MILCESIGISIKFSIIIFRDIIINFSQTSMAIRFPVKCLIKITNFSSDFILFLIISAVGKIFKMILSPSKILSKSDYGYFECPSSYIFKL